MSFLLDALRKSEMERRVGEVPKLSPDLLTKPEQPNRHPLVWPIVVLILVNIATLSYVALRTPSQSDPALRTPLRATKSPSPVVSRGDPTADARSESAGPGDSPTDQASKPESTRSGSSPARTQPRLTTPEAVTTMEPQTTARPPAAKTPADVPGNHSVDVNHTRTAGARVESGRTDPVPSRPLPGNAPPEVPPKPRMTAKPAKSLLRPASPALQAPALSPPEPPFPDPKRPSQVSGTLPAGDPIPLLNRMPRDFQRDVPSLNINVFVYSENPAERFVIVNMSKYRAGEKIDNGPQIEEIKPDSLVLDYHGRKFRILRP